MRFNSEDIIHVQNIMHSSAVDGTGFRDVLFVNYCPHRCEGCHNKQTWEYENGKDMTVDEVFADLTLSSITNVTFSGGEPFCQPKALISLAKKLKEVGKTIWAYSGFTFEQLMADPDRKALLTMCDVLVDGKYIEAEAKLNMRFKGSENQRIIDVKKSLAANQVVLFDLEF